MPTDTDLTAPSPALPPGKATRIILFSFNTPQMRAFHMSWFAFFLCFLAWFGMAPLMKYVKKEVQLEQDARCCSATASGWVGCPAWNPCRGG